MINLPLPPRETGSVLPGQPSNSSTTDQPASPLKRVSLGEFIQPLVAAAGQRQPWLEDFGDESIMLPADLYDVIREYARLQFQASTGSVTANPGIA